MSAWDSSKKKADPISERSRALSEEIAALEAQIRDLDSQTPADAPASAPKLRSTARPRGASTVVHHPPAAPKKGAEPIFEEVDQGRLKSKSDDAPAPQPYNDLGVRKYDLAAFIERLKKQFSRTVHFQSQVGQLPGGGQHPGPAADAL